MKNKKILITGGAGYLGSVLVKNVGITSFGFGCFIEFIGLSFICFHFFAVEKNDPRMI
jgi:hypothetical protein